MYRVIYVRPGVLPGAAVLLALLVALGSAPSRAQLVVNEIDYDQESVDTAEFVEIKNVSGVSQPAGEFDLVLVNGTSGAEYDTVALPEVDLPPSGYLVICADASNVANCDLDVEPDTNWLQNGAPDAIAVVRRADGAIVDTVSYEGDTVAPYTEGSGDGLEDDGTEPGAGLSRFPDGIDTGANSVDLSSRCITPGAPNAEAAEDCDTAEPFVITGECPGEIHLTYSGGSPGGVAGIVFSAAAGSDPLGAGPCVGEPTELETPQLLTVLTLDADGGFALTRTAPSNVCGARVQIVNGSDCSLSNAASLP